MSDRPSQQLPPFFLVRQQVVGPVVDDVAATVRTELVALHLDDTVRPGQTVAITAGSRGIHNYATVIAAVAAHLRELGAEPFVVPAMGSHGGATAKGQIRVLASYGITAAGVGCEVRASMDTVELARSSFGFPIVTDRLAHEADHVVVCNRVKQHTSFTGTVESGLVKMAMIGLGKHVGAGWYHRAVSDHGWQCVVDDVAPLLLARANVLAGVALVERSDDRTALVEAFRGHEFLEREPALLSRATAWLPRLPFGHADLVLIDRIGKNISGAGLDVNVLGRKGVPHHWHPDAPIAVKYVAIRGLTSETDGNSIGVGLAELCRSRVLRETNVAKSRINALTALDLPAVMAPLDYETDAAIIDAALPLIGLREPPEARVQWIADTLHLSEAWCSAPYLDEATERDDLEVVSELVALPFDADGNLPDSIHDVMGSGRH